MTKKSSSRSRALAAGYRSGLEEKVASELDEAGVDAEYESVRLGYTVPARAAKYTPDFILPNGIVIETKGRFVTADRQKHKLIAKEHPDLDVRFVFSNPNSRISKKSKTTYARWCEDHGFHYAKQSIPHAWLRERPKKKRQRALESAQINLKKSKKGKT